MDSTEHVVFVHGLLGFGQGEVGQVSYWGDALDVERPSSLARPHEAIVGPLSSSHDRACELAAQIKGTRVDYGKEHSEDAHHRQWGRDFSDSGFVPDWSEEHPIHLVGHSLGAPTIRCLQHLLEEDFWGWGTNHRWIRSISTISGVNNGTTAVYLFGADEESGLIPDLRRGDGLYWFFTLYVNVTKTGRVKSGLAYDLKLEQWGIARQPDDSSETYMERVAATDFLKGSDHGFYSVSIQAALDYNRRWRTYPDTYYFSYVTEQTHGTSFGIWLPGLP